MKTSNTDLRSDILDWTLCFNKVILDHIVPPYKIIQVFFKTTLLNLGLDPSISW